MSSDIECSGPISFYKFRLYNDTVSQDGVVLESTYSSLSPKRRIRVL